MVSLLTILVVVVEKRLTEMVRMGVGNKPSLDLKQSEDNISDRAIAFQRSKFLFIS